MSKKATNKGVTPKEQSLGLNRVSKKSSHTGGLPLTESLYDDNVMVTQKIRKAQERKSRSRGNSRNKVS